jgi:cytochrome c-type biogenesis protein CcmI
VSTSLQLVVLALAVALAVGAVAFPLVRPPRSSPLPPEPPAHEASRARLLRAVEELERDRRAGMITQADYDAGVADVRRRLARQAASSSGET